MRAFFKARDQLKQDEIGVTPASRALGISEAAREKAAARRREGDVAMRPERVRDLVLFNLAIDSKLRGCDVVALKVDDIAPGGYARRRGNPLAPGNSEIIS